MKEVNISISSGDEDTSDSDSSDSSNASTHIAGPSRKRLFEELEMSQSPPPQCLSLKKAALDDEVAQPPQCSTPKEATLNDEVTQPPQCSTPKKSDENKTASPATIPGTSSVDLDKADSSFDLNTFPVDKLTDDKKIASVLSSFNLTSKHCNFFALLPCMILLKCKNNLHFYIAPFRNIKGRLIPRFFSDFHTCKNCSVPTKLEVFFYVPSLVSANPLFTRSFKTLVSCCEKVQLNSTKRYFEISCEVQSAISTLIAIKYTNARTYVWNDSAAKSSRGTPLDMIKKDIFLEGERMPQISNIALFQRLKDLCDKKANHMIKTFENSEYVNSVVAFEQAAENTVSSVEKEASKNVFSDLIKITGNTDRKIKEATRMKNVEKAVEQLASKTINNPKKSPNVKQRLFESTARELSDYDQLINKYEKKIESLIDRTAKKKKYLRSLYERRDNELNKLRRVPNRKIFPDD